MEQHLFCFSKSRTSRDFKKTKNKPFDEETLVDFSDLKTVWNIDAGYMFSQKFGGFLKRWLIS
jgi:hypothetical protein